MVIFRRVALVSGNERQPDDGGSAKPSIGHFGIKLPSQRWRNVRDHANQTLSCFLLHDVTFTPDDLNVSITFCNF